MGYLTVTTGNCVVSMRLVYQNSENATLRVVIIIQPAADGPIHSMLSITTSPASLITGHELDALFDISFIKFNILFNPAHIYYY